MKRLTVILAAVMIVLGTITGCQKTTEIKKNGELQIVAAGYAEYDWVRQILGEQSDNAEVTMLLEDGVDLHSFQPAVDDMVKIAESDLFIYIDGTEDSWVDEALSNTSKEDQIVLNLIDVLGDAVKPETVLEGMTHEHEQGHVHEETHEHEQGHVHEENHEHEEDHMHEDAVVDEHIWLSLKNAIACSQRIAESLSEIDPDHAEVYEQNAELYIEKLNVLDQQYQAVAESGTKEAVLFCDRFPFRYMMEDYGIDYYAAFSGCSTDTEASFETIAFLADTIEELELHSVVMIEGSEVDLAETVLENTSIQKAAILTMNSMQSVNAKTAKSMTYLSVMEENLKVLETALR